MVCPCNASAVHVCIVHQQAQLQKDAFYNSAGLAMDLMNGVVMAMSLAVADITDVFFYGDACTRAMRRCFQDAHELGNKMNGQGDGVPGWNQPKCSWQEDTLQEKDLDDMEKDYSTKSTSATASKKQESKKRKRDFHRCMSWRGVRRVCFLPLLPCRTLAPTLRLRDGGHGGACQALLRRELQQCNETVGVHEDGVLH